MHFPLDTMIKREMWVWISQGWNSRGSKCDRDKGGALHWSMIIKEGKRVMNCLSKNAHISLNGSTSTQELFEDKNLPKMTNSSTRNLLCIFPQVLLAYDSSDIYSCYQLQNISNTNSISTWCVGTWENSQDMSKLSYSWIIITFKRILAHNGEREHMPYFTNKMHMI